MPARRTWTLMEFADWVLLHNSSPFTICKREEFNPPAMHTAPAASAATFPANVKPEPTTDKEPEPTTMSAPELMPEPNIVPEPEPSENSDQVRELATSSLPLEVLMEYEGMKWSPVPSTKVPSAPLINLQESAAGSTTPVFTVSHQPFVSTYTACLVHCGSTLGL